MGNKEVFSTHEAARMCHVHHTTIINWINKGKMPFYSTPGGHRRIKRKDLLDFVEKYDIPRSPELGSIEKKVLLIDDDQQALSELTEALQGEGFALEVASDGFEAGKRIYGKTPDLILLDFKMPGMDGFQVCRSLKKDIETRDIPVIAVTVLSSEYDLARMKKYGVEWYVEKPVDVEDMAKLIRLVLGLESVDRSFAKRYSLEKTVSSAN